MPQHARDLRFEEPAQAAHRRRSRRIARGDRPGAEIRGQHADDLSQIGIRGFKSLKTAYATIKGFEVMHALRKGQARAFCLQPGIGGEVRLIERAFGRGSSAMAEAAQIVADHYQMAA